jgi:hypothetical protein
MIDRAVTAKRLAYLIVCAALVCGSYPAGASEQRSASRGPDALTCDRTCSVPAELGADRVSPRLLTFGRQFSSNHVHPAITTASGDLAVAGWSTRRPDPAPAGRRPSSVEARGERGPPHHVFS